MSGGARGAVVGGVVLLVLIAVVGWLVPLATGQADQGVAGDAHVAAHRAHAVLSLVADGSGSEVVRADALRAAQATVLQAVTAVAESGAVERYASVDVLLVRSIELLQRLEQGADSSSRAALLADLRDTSGALRAELGTVAPVGAPPSGALVGGATVPVFGIVLALALGAAAIVLIVRSPRASPPAAAGAAAAGGAPPSDVAGPPGAVTRPVGGITTDIGEHPQLEGIASADELEHVVERERERSTRYEHPVAFIDLVVDQGDRLRSTHGEATLEYVVLSVAELARDNTRSADTVAVLAADRVGVLLPETSIDHAEAVADKLCRSVALFPFSDGIHATVTSRCRDLLADSTTASS